jgi:hypothetical protein
MPQTNAVSQAGESRMSEWITLTNKRAMRPEALPETPKKSPGWCSPQFVSARRNMMSYSLFFRCYSCFFIPRLFFGGLFGVAEIPHAGQNSWHN